MTTKQLDIKDKSCYFYNDLIKLSKFSADNFRIDKKTWKDIDIYYIGYIDKSKPEEWKVNSVNLSYLIINKVFCFVGEKNGVKYLKIVRLKNFSDTDTITIWNQVFNGIKDHIENNSSEKVNYDSDYDKIKFVSNDLLKVNLFSNINSCD